MIAPADLPDHRGKGYYIYGLTEPGTERVRYIGRTGNLAARYKAHCKAHGQTLPQNQALADWIQVLADAGKRPGVRILAHIIGRFAQLLAGHAENQMIGWWSQVYAGDLLQKRGVVPRKPKRERSVTFRGRTQSVTAWAKEIGISRQGLHQRLEKHSVTAALKTPAPRQRAQVA